jgi:hypothetical protein
LKDDSGHRVASFDAAEAIAYTVSSHTDETQTNAKTIVEQA